MVSYSVLLGNYQEGKYNEIMPKIYIDIVFTFLSPLVIT